MGVVFEAEQDSPRRRVALKVIRPVLESDARLRRFRRECEVLGRLEHPGIARIYEAGTFEHGGATRPYFAMELVEGVPVTVHASRLQLPPRERLTLVAAICEAVQHAHGKGVVHRDLKPDNVLVRADGRPVVLDFGVARMSDPSTVLTTMHTASGEILGTLAYMAPEQLGGDPAALGPRADVYALGVMLFELLANRLPHDLTGLPIGAAIRVLTEREPARLGVFSTGLAGDVETIVGKALEVEPERRYASAAALGADLTAFLADRPIAARPPSRLDRVVKFARRHKGLVGGAAATLLAILAGLVTALVLLARESEQRALAEENAGLARVGERRAVGGLIQATADVLELGDLWRAALLYQRVLEPDRGWEVDFVGGALPAMLPGYLDAGNARWLDDRRLLLRHRDGPVVEVEVGTWRELQRLPEEFPHEPVILDAAGRVREFRREWDQGVFVFLAGGEERARIPITSEATYAFPSPGGTRVALFTHEFPLRVYDADTGSLLGEVDGLRRPGAHSAYYRHGSGQLLTFDRRLQLVAIEVERPRIVRRYEDIEGELWWCGGDVTRDGALFAYAVGGRARAWELESGERVFEEPLQLLEGGRYRVRFSPDGERLLVTVRDVGSCILDLGAELTPPEALGTDGDPRVITYRGHGAYVYTLAVSPAGRLIASRSHVETGVHVWDAASGEVVATLPVGSTESPVHDNRGKLMAFSPDGRRLLVTARAGYARPELLEFDLLTGDVARTELPESLEAGSDLSWIDGFLEALGPAPAMRLGRKAHLLSDGTAVAVQQDSVGGTVPPGERWREVRFRLDEEGLGVAPDGGRFAVGSRSAVHVLDARDQSELARFGGQAYAVAWSPDGRLIAAGGTSGRIRLYDAEVYTELLSFRAHDDYIFSLAWTPDGSRLVSCSGDATVRVWDARTRAARAADEAAYRRRLEALRPLDDAQLLARFESAGTPEERGALVRLALERR